MTTTRALSLDVRPLSGYTGAEIAGVDLRDDLSDDVVEAIKVALWQWKVVFFRGQKIGHAEHVAFARRFGKVTPAHPYVAGRFEEYPEIGTVTDSRAEDRIRSIKPQNDNGWHTDISSLINPPAAAILRSEIVPPYGGDTQFTNLVAAYEGLPEPLRQFADGLRAVHRFPLAFDGRGNTPLERRMADNPMVVIHPVVRVHPESGERALFVSPGFTGRVPEIVGFSPRHSRRILELFHEEVGRLEYTCRFRWEPGSVAFWDERTTAHMAPSDHLHLGVERVLHRLTLEGDVPVGPDGQPSELISGEPFLAIER